MQYSDDVDASIAFKSNFGFNETQLEKIIEDTHFRFLDQSFVNDATTSYDFDSTSLEVHVSTKPNMNRSELSTLNNMVTPSVRNFGVNVDIPIKLSHSVGGKLITNASLNTHRGGEYITGLLEGCTSGFGVLSDGGTAGISTSAHCPENLFDDGRKLTRIERHYGNKGDFQWHTGTGFPSDDFYSGTPRTGPLETNLRDVNCVANQFDDCYAMMANMFVCMNGDVSMKRCDQIDRVSTCTEFLCDVVAMKNRKGAKGDSGGPVFLNNTAFGIYNGSTALRDNQGNVIREWDTFTKAENFSELRIQVLDWSRRIPR